MSHLLLIHPPVVKPCEPPAGLARLAGALEAGGCRVTLLDANLASLYHVWDHGGRAQDTWTRRARRHCSAHLAALRRPRLYRHPARYQRAVRDLNRLLERGIGDQPVTLSLSNYQDRRRSPLRSADLLAAARHPEANPFYRLWQERLTAILGTSEITTVGLSLNYLSQALCTFALAGMIRRMRPDVGLVLGGGLVTSWLRRPDWQNPFTGVVDHLVAGPGEAFLLRLVNASAPSRPVPPAYDQSVHLPYLAPGLVLPYSASTGCFWRRCAFCPERAENTPYRPLPARRVLGDLTTLAARHRPVLFHLVDNALAPALLQRLATTPPGVPWYGFARITPQLADPDFCRALRRAGCVMLKLGVESGSQAVLDALDKGIRIKTAAAVLRSLNRAGIRTYVYLLFGTPAESAAEAEATLQWAVRQSTWIDFLNVAIFNLPAAGPDAARLVTRPFYAGDLSLYRDFVHPAGWQREQVRRFVERRFKRHPALAPVVRRQPFGFGSNHAPFMPPVSPPA